jgi:hypothetical protein
VHVALPAARVSKATDPILIPRRPSLAGVVENLFYGAAEFVRKGHSCGAERIVGLLDYALGRREIIVRLLWCDLVPDQAIVSAQHNVWDLGTNFSRSSGELAIAVRVITHLKKV